MLEAPSPGRFARELVLLQTLGKVARIVLSRALPEALPADAGTEAYPAPHYGSCGVTCL